MHAPLHPRDDPARGESQRVTVNTPYVPSIIHKLTQYLNNVFGRHANPVKIPPPPSNRTKKQQRGVPHRTRRRIDLVWRVLHDARA